MQDYKCVSAAVMICATLVNTQTHRQLLTGYILLAQPAEIKNCSKGDIRNTETECSLLLNIKIHNTVITTMIITI